MVWSPGVLMMLKSHVIVSRGCNIERLLSHLPYHNFCLCHWCFVYSSLCCRNYISTSGGYGVLKTFSVTGVNFRIVMDRKLGLNEERTKEFEKGIRESVKSLLLSVLNGDFRAALSSAVALYPLPKP